MQPEENKNLEVKQGTKKKGSKSITISIIVILVCTFLLLAVLLLSLNSNRPTVEPHKSEDSQSDNNKTDKFEGFYSIKLVSIQENKSSLYLINSLKQENILISDKVLDASLSPDGELVAYTEVDNDNYSLIIYRISSKESTAYLDNDSLTEIFVNPQTISNITWSPLGKYLLVESGTGVSSRGQTAIDYSTKDVSSTFTVSGKYYWIGDDNEVVFTAASSIIDSDNKPFDTGLLTKISKVNVETGNKSDLLLPKKGMEYSLTDETPIDRMISVSKVIYDGSGGIQKTELLYVNVDSGELSPLSAPQ